MAVNMGETGKGLQRSEVLYEGTFTRIDVETNNGTVEGGGTWAAPFDNDDIVDGYAYVQEYTTYGTQIGYKRMETSDVGTLIKGRVISIEHAVPTVSANGGTSVSALATDRQGTVEHFFKGQRFLAKVNANSANLAINDLLSISTTDAGIFIKDAGTGSFKCLESSTTDGDVILVEVT